VDQDGKVTVVYGRSKIEGKLKGLTCNYLEDTRPDDQRVLGFVYRNLLPTDDFAEDCMYKDEYLPEATVCSEDEFLNNSKAWLS
jgi:hypothetical protein